MVVWYSVKLGYNKIASTALIPPLQPEIQYVPMTLKLKMYKTMRVSADTRKNYKNLDI